MLYKIEGDVRSTNVRVTGNIINNAMVSMPTYDGSYEVTPNTTTQILYTADKQMAENVVVNPMPQPSWLGINEEYLGEIYNYSKTLAQTDYNTWTPSATATTIVPTVALTPITIDTSKYDYYIKWLMDANFTYNNGATTRAMVTRFACVYMQEIYMRPNTLEQIETDNFAYNVNAQNCFPNAAALVYYNTSGNLVAQQISYGPAYLSALQNATISGVLAETPSVTINTPVISARCSNSYFSTANAALIDKTKSTIKMKGYMYRVQKKSSPTSHMNQELVNVYANPL